MAMGKTQANASFVPILESFKELFVARAGRRGEGSCASSCAYETR